MWATALLALQKVNPRVWIGLGIAAAIAGALLAIYLAGGSAERSKTAVRDAGDERDAAGVNGAIATSVIIESDAHARSANQLNQEAAHARRQFERPRAAAPGTVGAQARIDPALARDAICRVRELRHLPPCPALAAGRAAR